MKISKVAPRFTLSGLGATILMDGATSGTTTLRPYAVAGGTIVIPQSAGTDTLSTRAYARSIVPDTTSLSNRIDLKADTVDQEFTGTIGLPTITEYNGVRMDSVFVKFTGSPNLGIDIGDNVIYSSSLATFGKIKVSDNGVQIDSIKSDGSNIVFYSGSDTLIYEFPAGYIDTGMIPADSVGGDGSDLYITLSYFNTNKFDSTYIYNYADSLKDVISSQQSEIQSLWEAIGNIGDYIPPRFLSAELGTYSDSILIVILDSADVQQDSIPNIASFTLKENRTTFGLNSVDIGHDTIFISLDSLGYAGGSYTISYNKSADYPQLQDSTENLTPSWTNKVVTNNCGWKSADFETIYEEFSTKPTEAMATLMDAMVYSLDSAGYWDKMEVFYNFANHDSLDAFINWINPGTYNATNTKCTWTQWYGFAGNNTDAYLSTIYNPTTNGGKYTQNDAAIGVYVNNNIQEDNKFIFGEYTASNTTHLMARNTSNQANSQINSTGGLLITSITDSRGLWIVSRTASNSWQTYNNGVQIGTDTDASGGVPDNNITIFQRHGSGGYSNNEVSIFFIMSKVNNATEADVIYDIIERYINAVR